MADRGRGGNQPPRNPAAVSTPGSGRRTDGGAGSTRQPIRVPSGGAYGERKALTEQQQAAPMESAGPTGGTAAPSPQQGGAAPVGGQGIFGPTGRPNEPNTMGANAPAMHPAAANPQAMLRVMYAKFPHPSIARLIDWTLTD